MLSGFRVAIILLKLSSLEYKAEFSGTCVKISEEFFENSSASLGIVVLDGNIRSGMPLKPFQVLSYEV